MQLAASIDAAAITTGGTAQVWVTNPAPGGGKSNPVNFSISGGPNPIPAINSLSPDVATVGGPAFTLTVYGSRIDSFVDSSVVRWNGSDRPTAFVTSNQLTAQVPASDIDAIGTAAVSVFTPAPGGGVSNTANFTIATGGVGPTSMTVAPDPAGKFGKFAYVTNSRTNNVSMYTIHSDGTLTPIAPGTIATGTTPSSVAVDPSGKFAYVTNSGLSQAGNVSVYTINADGKLTPNGAIPAGSYPRSIAIDPLGRFAYVANSGGCGGAGLGDLSMYTINSDGTLTLLAPGTIAAGVCPSAVAVDPSGKFAYAADTGDCDFLVGSISIYKINPAFAGTLSATAMIDAGACPLSVAVAMDPSGKFGGFVYVANSEYFGASSVLMYSIDSVSGVLTPLTSTGTIAAGTDSRSVAVHPSGKFAYVANFGSNDVSMYSIDTATGALQSIGSGTVAAGLGPMSIAIDPSGKFAYVANSTSNDVSIYGIDAATGALTLIATIST